MALLIPVSLQQMAEWEFQDWPTQIDRRFRVRQIYR
jgi:hypothetical protein